MASHFLKEIEGLRGVLALWVIMSHLMWGSGFTSESAIGWWAVPFAGGAAVDVFICISGFVIFLLISKMMDGYKAYIIKRFFRLYPLFIVTTVIGAILFFLRLGIYGVNYHGPGVFVREAEYYNQIPTLIITNILMLQGFLPKLGPIVFNPPSWSISVEWQFYLVAPLIFILFNKCWLKISIGILIIVIIKDQFIVGPLINAHGATILDRGVPFLIGMISFQFYRLTLVENKTNISIIKFLKGITVLLIIISTIPMVIILSKGGKVSMPWTMSYGIWIWVILTIIERVSSGQDHAVSFTSLILNSRLAQKLGKISYSLYLNHQLIIYIFLLFFGKFVIKLGMYKSFILELIVLVPVTIIISNFTYSFIETPGIKLGKKLALKIPRKY